MKIGFISLGCPKNQLDTEVMLHHLASASHEITPEETEADIVIINTCAFIESAKKESIDNILDIAWLKKHHSLKAISGYHYLVSSSFHPPIGVLFSIPSRY